MRGDDSFWTALAARRLSRRSSIRAGLAVAGGAGVILAGCGGGKAPQSSGQANKPSASGAPSANLKTGGTIQLYFSGPIGLDPYENSSFRAQDLAGMSYSRLFKFNAGPDAKVTLSREPVPDLVSSYEITPDGLTYTMKLRPDAKFHAPLSRPLTSADVISSFQRFTTDAKNPNGAVFKPFVDSVTAPDSQSVVFKLKAPYSPFLNVLANPQYFWIMS
ncbi:MAG TPA: ABC transporter substrate-binding protein, partial [Bryobacteraceae bacterium]|nr:ABC transporter substrate-binding protein [Bryobacteraceae bacterium]